MQSPLETPVQALRNTRLVEEICAWTTVNVQFPHVTFTSGLQFQFSQLRLAAAQTRRKLTGRFSPSRSSLRPMLRKSIGERLTTPLAENRPCRVTCTDMAFRAPISP